MDIYINLNDPDETTLAVDMQTCPRKDEHILINGKEYVVKEVCHCVRIGTTRSSHGQTTVDVEKWRD